MNRKWMQGRYGVDAYSRFLAVLAAVLAIISYFRRSKILSFIAIGFLSWSYLRMFSKNIAARRRENERYLQKKEWVLRGPRQWKRALFGTRTERYFRCPGCHTVLRVPKGKGKIRIRCPKCQMEMTKRT